MGKKKASLRDWNILKRLTRSEAFLTAAGGLSARYIRFVFNTAKPVYEPADAAEKLLAATPSIVAMWHGQFLMIPAAAPKGLPVKCMVARHGDAEIVGRALQKFGHGLIRGAGAGVRRKDRGGVHALRAALRTLEAGETVAMTADVPPGPARKAGIGIVTLARMSGRPIVPVAIATNRFAAFNTWSRFTVNLPFAKMGIVCGDPVHVAADASAEDMEAARAAVEERLNAATRRAYDIAGGNIARATPADPTAVIAPDLKSKTAHSL